MARIRTIKPEFFTHEVLFDAEKDTGLPLRVAFAGLWTQADRQGRFEWRPRPLKAAILPYDDLDFSRVLDALATRGFIQKYSIEGGVYGCIPSWKDHQSINNRERDSDIPPPCESAMEDVVVTNDNDASSTRHPRVIHASGKVTSGKEGERKGRGKEYPPTPKGAGGEQPAKAIVEDPAGEPSPHLAASPTEPEVDDSFEILQLKMFEEMWKVFPKTRIGSKDKAYKAFQKALDRASGGDILRGAKAYAVSEEALKNNGHFAKGCAAWLNDDRWTHDYKPFNQSHGGTNGKGADYLNRIDRVMQETRAELGLTRPESTHASHEPNGTGQGAGGDSSVILDHEDIFSPARSVEGHH